MGVITAEMLAFYGAGMRRMTEKGKFQVFIGANSEVEKFQVFHLV